MKTLLMLLAILALSASTAWAAGNGICDRTRDRVQDPAVCLCVDLDGDGICDLCDRDCVPKGEDADGDGIPNGQDDDYTPPQDGSGRP